MKSTKSNKPSKKPKGASSMGGKKPPIRGNLADLVLVSVAALGSERCYVLVRELPRGQHEHERVTLIQRVFAGGHDELRSGRTVLVGHDLSGDAPRGPLSRASSSNDEYLVEVTATPPAGAPDVPFEGVVDLNVLDVSPLLLG